MESDEYMNPKTGSSMPGPSRLGSSSTTGADVIGSVHNGSGRHNWDRELRKFGDTHRLGGGGNYDYNHTVFVWCFFFACEKTKKNN